MDPIISKYLLKRRIETYHQCHVQYLVGLCTYSEGDQLDIEHEADGKSTLLGKTPFSSKTVTYCKKYNLL